MPMVNLCVLVVSKKLSEDTQDTYGQRLPHVSPLLFDYSLDLLKHFKMKVHTNLNISYSSF